MSNFFKKEVVPASSFIALVVVIVVSVLFFRTQWIYDEAARQTDDLDRLRREVRYFRDEGGTCFAEVRRGGPGSDGDRLLAVTVVPCSEDVLRRIGRGSATRPAPVGGAGRVR